MPQSLEKPPFFTIATVTKNNLKGLKFTAQSIQSQNFTDYEWLIQDGESTDNTLKYIEELNKSSLHGLSVQSSPDSGIYDAMNRLITRAKGDYILFLNAGDALASPETLEIIHKNATCEALAKQVPDFIYGDSFEHTTQPIHINTPNTQPAEKEDYDYVKYKDCNHTILEFDGRRKLSAFEKSDAGIRSSISRRFFTCALQGKKRQFAEPSNFKIKKAKSHTKITHGMFTHHQAMLYRRNAIQNLRYDENYKIAADYDFTARFLKQNNNDAFYIPEPICIFQSGGISQQNAAQGRHEQFQIRKNLNLCPPLQNHIIKAVQALNFELRKHAPMLYWALKRKSIKSTGDSLN